MSVTDGLILSKILDGTIIVAKSGKTTYDIVARGMILWRGKKGNPIDTPSTLGLVINGFDIKKADQYYYSYIIIIIPLSQRTVKRTNLIFMVKKTGSAWVAQKKKVHDRDPHVCQYPCRRPHYALEAALKG